MRSASTIYYYVSKLCTGLRIIILPLSLPFFFQRFSELSGIHPLSTKTHSLPFLLIQKMVSVLFHLPQLVVQSFDYIITRNSIHCEDVSQGLVLTRGDLNFFHSTFPHTQAPSPSCPNPFFSSTHSLLPPPATHFPPLLLFRHSSSSSAVRRYVLACQDLRIWDQELGFRTLQLC